MDSRTPRRLLPPFDLFKVKSKYVVPHHLTLGDLDIIIPFTYFKKYGICVPPVSMMMTWYRKDDPAIAGSRVLDEAEASSRTTGTTYGRSEAPRVHWVLLEPKKNTCKFEYGYSFFLINGKRKLIHDWNLYLNGKEQNMEEIVEEYVNGRFLNPSKRIAYYQQNPRPFYSNPD